MKKGKKKLQISLLPTKKKTKIIIWKTNKKKVKVKKAKKAVDKQQQK